MSCETHENPFKGKHHTEETKQLLSKKTKEYLKTHEHPMKGKHHSEETKQLMNKKKKEYYETHRHYNWKGGIGKEPYPFEFDDNLKEFIRDRDYRECQLCYKTEEENGRELDVHHIDYDKHNLDKKNLITLCRSCNVKVNQNRELWTFYFTGLQAMDYERMGAIYTK